ncbi:MAG: helix-turn-helix domain-containing protein, partial [Patescibacteria group bacterium]
MYPHFEKNLIPTKEAAELSGYTSDYLSRLARSGKISACRVGHTWLVDVESLTHFLNKQGDRKIDYARALARAREEEYRALNSPVQKVTGTLTKPLPMPEKLGIAVTAFRTHALAVSLSLAVVVSGALAQHQIIFGAGLVAQVANEAHYGFGETFGNIPSRIAARIEKAGSDMRSVSPALKVANASISNPFANLDLSSLQMAVTEGGREPRFVSSKQIISFSTAPITFENLQMSALNAYGFFTSASRITNFLTGAHNKIGTISYDAISEIFSSYEFLVENSGIKTLTLSVSARDAIATAPRIVSDINLAFGNAIIKTAHSAIRADTLLAYGLAEMAPKSSRAAVAFIGEVGGTLAGVTVRTTVETPIRIALALRSFSEAGPAIASSVFNAEYGASARFVKDIQSVSGIYLGAVKTAGRLYSDGSLALRGIGESAPPAIKDAYLAALGKSALALDSFAKAPKVAAVLSVIQSTSAPIVAAVEPALNAGEQVAFATYKTIRGLFNSANQALAVLFGPPPSIVLPTPDFQHTKTTARPATSNQQPATNSYPTYNTNTIVQGVSQDFVNQSIASLRADILATTAGLIRPVYTQTVTNAATTQMVNKIEDLSNLIVRNGDFRGGVFDNGERISAKTGTFTNLNGGATSLAGTTITGDLSVSGTLTSGIVSASDYIKAPYFVATSTTATSTFAGRLAIGTTTPWGDGLFTAGTTTPLLYISSNSGRIGVGTSSPSVAFDIYSTSAIRIPVGTSAQRPGTGDVGYIRFNMTTHQFEGYGDNSVWQGLGGVIDADQDTYVTADTNNADEDTLRFFTFGTQRMTLTPSGLVGIGTTSPYSLLSISNSASTAANTPLFTIASTTGGTSTSTLMTVLANGNVGIATTSPSAALSVSGNALLSGTTGITLSGAGAGITFIGTGNHDIAASGGTLRIGSNTIIGNVGALDDTVDIGTSATRFDKIYANEVNATTLVGTLTGGNLTAETFSINSDNATADAENSYLAFERGSVSPNALLTWNVSSRRFEFNQPLYIENASGGLATTTLDIKAVEGQTADLFRIASSSGANLLNFSAGGNLGIGTTTPSNLLSVHGNSYVSGTSFFGGALTATSSLIFSNFTGILSSNGTSGVSARTLTGTANQITITNGDGTAGNPTFSLPSLLSFTNASTSQFSIFQKAYFGATATSTFDSTGA